MTPSETARAALNGNVVDNANDTYELRLPTLPKHPFCVVHGPSTELPTPCYSAVQMLTYGRLCIECDAAKATTTASATLQKALDALNGELPTSGPSRFLNGWPIFSEDDIRNGQLAAITPARLVIEQALAALSADGTHTQVVRRKSDLSD